MSRSLTLIAAVGGQAMILTFSASSQTTGFYLSAGLGPAFTEDTSLKEFNGPISGTKVKFDPGVQFRFAGGYNITDWLATELESGFTYNHIRSITGADEVHGSLSNVPLLANLVLQGPRTMRVVPFIGGGLGFSSAVLDVHPIDLNGLRLRGTQSDAVFAYHGFGGLRYNINEHMAVSLAYNYFATSNPTWEADVISGPGTGNVRFGDNRTHAVTASFTYNF